MLYSGDTDFGPIRIRCRPPTLIPRPETAYVFERLAREIATRRANRGPLRILDLYTGSGAIPLLIRHVLGETDTGADADVVTVAVDIQQDAISLAKENARMLLPEKSDTFITIRDDVTRPGFANDVRDRIGDRRDRLDVFDVANIGSDSFGFDVITANPPYISSYEADSLSRSVAQYEDQRALFDDLGEDGLGHYRVLASLVKNILKPKLVFATETGATQGSAVCQIFQNQGLATEVWQDQWGMDRLVVTWFADQ